MNHRKHIQRASRASIALVAASLAFSAHGATLVDLAQVRASLAAPSALAISADLEKLAQRGSAVDIVVVLRERVLAGSLSPVAREALLERGLHLLAALPGQPASRALATDLASRPPQVLVRGDPGHAAQGVPLYDVGAVARFAQRAWLRRDARDAGIAAIRARRSGLIEAFAARPTAAELDIQKAGVVDAFAAARDPDLLTYRVPLVAAAENGGHADELLLLFARRLRDPELFALLFDRGESSVAVHAIGTLTHDLAGEAAVGVLVHAMEREELASAALLSMSDLAATQPEARRVLFESLRDPGRGASAAAALGKLQDPSVAAELERRLESAADENTRRYVALALHFDGSSAATQVLERFAASGKGSRELHKEVNSWLGRQ